MMLHMVYSVYCLLSPCPASCSWKRGRGGCTGGRGRGRRSSAARAAPAAAATWSQSLLQGTGEVYWGNVKNIRCLFESCKFSQSRRRPLLGPSPGRKRLQALSHLTVLSRPEIGTQKQRSYRMGRGGCLTKSFLIIHIVE